MTRAWHVLAGLRRGFSLRAAVALAPSGDKGDRIVAAALVVVAVWLGLDAFDRWLDGERLEAMSAQKAATVRTEALLLACLNSRGLVIDGRLFHCAAFPAALSRSN